jgi:hypothetical protein
LLRQDEKLVFEECGRVCLDIYKVIHAELDDAIEKRKNLAEKLIKEFEQEKAQILT